MWPNRRGAAGGVVAWRADNAPAGAIDLIAVLYKTEAGSYIRVELYGHT